MVMAATIVATHGHDLYNCGILRSWLLLLWLLKVMASTIVTTHGHGLYHIIMAMASTIVATHGHGI